MTSKEKELFEKLLLVLKGAEDRLTFEANRAERSVDSRAYFEKYVKPVSDSIDEVQIMLASNKPRTKKIDG